MRIQDRIKRLERRNHTGGSGVLVVHGYERIGFRKAAQETLDKAPATEPGYGYLLTPATLPPDVWAEWAWREMQEQGWLK